MTAEREKKCLTCKWWSPDESCHLIPPSIDGRWPKTEPDDWCGKWEDHIPDTLDTIIG